MEAMLVCNMALMPNIARKYGGGCGEKGMWNADSYDG